MTHIADIPLKIKEAMASACSDMLMFAGTPSKVINTEYLFTVNVAKAITRLNGYHADPYQVSLEHGTKKFAKDCLYPIIFGNSLKRGSSIFRRGTPKIDRNGRIDVTVYIDHPNNAYLGAQPLCAIELKAFNPQRKLVIDDLKRNLEYFRLSGPTGNSVLAFTIFAALHSFTKYGDEIQVRLNESETKAKYEKWVSELGNLNDINVDIETFTVSKELLGCVFDEGEYQVLDTASRHHFVGAIVRFSKKSN